ncbi:LLM class flavin-dependent oxidoreductase [Amycolatopsis sp.]|uniref:LLM class flavin-dependent oxidoreductase n=1 Tax=Amycolatopsis sp. TaxID=37632 RepID=UPI002D7FBEAF|nr:LLM class flavin-dependent oxidoreductase [Amycolatopsis sp.]HET6706661.1 LLM class flavin-dependent oxidoreductase [Amycolatopsis sp.]
MTALWTDPAPAYRGEFAEFSDVDAPPRPARPGSLVGGHSSAAFRRAVSRGHGWFGNGGLDDLPRRLAGLRRTAEKVDQPARPGPAGWRSANPPLDPVAVDARAAERYAALGVDRLVVYPLPLERPGSWNATLRSAGVPGSRSARGTGWPPAGARVSGTAEKRTSPGRLE